MATLIFDKYIKKDNQMQEISERYFNDTNFLFKFLRTINLMEPGRAVISLSKLFFLLMMFIMVWVAIMSPDQITALVAAISGTALALLNYAKRRTDNTSAGIGIDMIVPSNMEEEIAENDPVRD